MEDSKTFMGEAIAQALKGMRNNEGGPFGAVVVKDGKIIARGNNKVATSNDPTAHAEVIAIREACKVLKSFQLTGCDLYTSCEPCPMCMGAIYWARPDRVFYACSKEDAAAVGFDDDFIYTEIDKTPELRKIPFIQLKNKTAFEVFKEWDDKEDKIVY